jgi:glucose-1-phosphate adenylyltransferase
MEEACRFGIMNTGPDGVIEAFEEKPKQPKSNQASMGVYIFKWRKLREYLEADESDPQSANDFGKNIIPAMLGADERMVAYRFEGYWKDVGTIESLWDANMDLIRPNSGFELEEQAWKIYSRNPVEPPHYIGPDAKIHNTMLTDGCEIYGRVSESIISSGAYVGAGAEVDHSVVMPGAVIAEGAVVRYAIVGEKATVAEGAAVGEAGVAITNEGNCIAVVGPGIRIGRGGSLAAGEMAANDIPDQTVEGVGK